MNRRLVGRWRGAYSLVVVLLLLAIGLPALAWTGLLSTTDQAGKEPAATDRETAKRVLDQPTVVEGAFRAEASVAREQAEDRSAEKAVAERRVREEDLPNKAAAGDGATEKADTEGAVEEAAAADGEISAGRGGIAAEPAVGQASAPAEASASASASAPGETTASAPPEAPAQRTPSDSPVEAQAASASAASSAPSDTTMTLEIPAIGVSVGVFEGTGEDSLSAGTGHLSGTGYPWVAGSNTYIAGHRLGYPGTPSDYVFWDLPSLSPGDEVLLTDANGKTYTYAVSEILEVPITDLSVTAPVGRDVVSLQTCIEDYGDYWTPGPNWNVRYVVRADKV